MGENLGVPISENQDEPLRYELVIESPPIDKVMPRGSSISRRIYSPLRPLVDYFFKVKPTSALNNDFPNAEVVRGYKDNWLSFGVRTAANPMDRPKRIKTISPESFSSFHTEVFDSGVSKIITQVEGKKVTTFVMPSDFVPYSFRAMDLFPNRGEQVAVSATLRKIASSARRRQEFPIIAMTAAGLNRMVIFGDVVYVKSLDGSPVETNVRRHIKETTVGIDTRQGAEYLTMSDFFDVLHNTVGEKNTITKAPYIPGLDAHWLVTRVDGSFIGMSTNELRMADQRSGFRETIASICSTLAYVNKTIAEEYDSHKDLPDTLVNSVVMFTLNGERRLSIINGLIDSNAIINYRLSKYIIENQYADAQEIEVAIVDGGGSAGAIVQKGKNWRNSEPHTFDISTLPLWALEHEIPMYIGFVPKSFVTEK